MSGAVEKSIAKAFGKKKDDVSEGPSIWDEWKEDYKKLDIRPGGSDGLINLPIPGAKALKRKINSLLEGYVEDQTSKGKPTRGAIGATLGSVLGDVLIPEQAWEAIPGAVGAAKGAKKVGSAAAKSIGELGEAMTKVPGGLQSGGYPGGKKALAEVLGKSGGSLGKSSKAASSKAVQLPSKMTETELKDALIDIEFNKSLALNEKQEAAMASMQRILVSELESRGSKGLKKQIVYGGSLLDPKDAKKLVDRGVADKVPGNLKGDLKKLFEGEKRKNRGDNSPSVGEKDAKSMRVELLEGEPDELLGVEDKVLDVDDIESMKSYFDASGGKDVPAFMARKRIEAEQAKGPKEKYKGALQRETFELEDPKKYKGRKDVVIDEEGRKYLEPDAGVSRDYHKDSKGTFLVGIRPDGRSFPVRNNPKTGKPLRDVFKRGDDHGIRKGYLSEAELKDYDVDPGEESLNLLEGDKDMPGFSFLVDQAEGAKRVAKYGPGKRSVGKYDPNVKGGKGREPTSVAKGRGILDDSKDTERELRDDAMETMGLGDDGVTNTKLLSEVRAVVERHGTSEDLRRIDSDTVTDDMLERLTESKNWEDKLAEQLEYNRMSDAQGNLLKGRGVERDDLNALSKKDASGMISLIKGKDKIRENAMPKAKISETKSSAPAAKGPPITEKQAKTLGYYGIPKKDIDSLSIGQASNLLDDLNAMGGMDKMKPFFKQGKTLDDLRALRNGGKATSIEDVKVAQKASEAKGNAKVKSGEITYGDADYKPQTVDDMRLHIKALDRKAAAAKRKAKKESGK